MFSIRFILYLYIISSVNAQSRYNDQKFHDDDDPIIDPLELVLSSTDTEGSFYCNGRVDLSKQHHKLVASIDNPIIAPPKFQLITEQYNSTTIRIRVLPNGYIGVNRISCHWDNNVTYGQSADLIIGEKPGVIQLKEYCQSHDRRYVECIFHTPTIVRAFRNGFPRYFQFTELNYETSHYRQPPTLVNITDKNELVFHFEPRDRNVIPKKVPMRINITLSRFGESIYIFNMDPVHTTEVNFTIENISKNKFTINIHQNRTGLLHRRLCSGHISQVDDKMKLTAVHDISATSDYKVSIDHLRPSMDYKICLRCFYEETDDSFKKEICQTTRTTKQTSKLWYILVIIVAVTISFISGVFIYRRCKRHVPGKEHLSTSNRKVKKPKLSSTKDLSDRVKELDSSNTRVDFLRYTTEPESHEPFIPPSHSSSVVSVITINNEVNDPANDAKYQDMHDFVLQRLTDKNKISPDTVDFVNDKNL